MEVVTIQGGATEISPSQLRQMMNASGRKQIPIVQKEATAGGDLVMDEATGKIIFEPVGSDPLKLKGLEIEVPQNMSNLGFAFGGQPVILSDDTGNQPEPLKIIGFSLPGGATFKGIDDFHKSVTKESFAGAPMKESQSRETVDVQGANVSRMQSLQTTNKPPLVKSQQVSTNVASLLSPRQYERSLARDGDQKVWRADPPVVMGNWQKPSTEMSQAQGLSQSGRAAPRMLFTSESANAAHYLYHQKLRPTEKSKPDSLCCGSNLGPSTTAAVMRVTADWLNSGRSTGDDRGRKPVMSNENALKRLPQRRFTSGPVAGQPMPSSGLKTIELMNSKLIKGQTPAPKSGERSATSRSHSYDPSLKSRHVDPQKSVKAYSPSAIQHPQVIDLGGSLGKITLPPSLIGNVPTKIEKPQSMHPQIPVVHEDGHADLVLDDEDLNGIGLTESMVEKLRSEGQKEQPMEKANKLIMQLKKTRQMEEIRMEEEERHQREKECLTVKTEIERCKGATLSNVPPVGAAAYGNRLHISASNDRMKVKEPDLIHRFEIQNAQGESRVIEKIELMDYPKIEFLRSFMSPDECESLNECLIRVDQFPHLPNNLLSAASALDVCLNNWLKKLANRIARICSINVDSIVAICPSVVHKSAVDATKEFSTIVRIYLDGAGTSDFPELGISVSPKVGTGLRWDCKDKEGHKSPLTKHKEIVEISAHRRMLTAYII